MKPQPTILDEAISILIIFQYNIKLYCYKCSRDIALKISENKVHKDLIIKYENKLYQNLN